MVVVAFALTVAVTPPLSKLAFVPLPIPVEQVFSENKLIVTVSDELDPMTEGVVLELFGLAGVVLTKVGSAGGELS